MRIVFMGTPDFSVPCLRELITAGHEIAAVFTKLDKPKNRGHKLTETPVKIFAKEYSIPIYQPNSLKKGDDAVKAFEVLTEINPDVIVVVAYGQILPENILELPKYGCINVHASLLPKYRGAAPIQMCIVNGEDKSGVTTMYMAKGIDTGNMILKKEVAITNDMTGSELHDILSEMGAGLIVETLKQAENGTAPNQPQDDSESSHVSVITKEMCRIDFGLPAKQVYNHIRGMSEVPCAYTFVDGKRLKVYMAALVEGESDSSAGTITDINKFIIVCGDKKQVMLTDVQIESGKRMSVEQFIRGYKLNAGSIKNEKEQ